MASKKRFFSSEFVVFARSMRSQIYRDLPWEVTLIKCILSTNVRLMYAKDTRWLKLWAYLLLLLTTCGQEPSVTKLTTRGQEPSVTKGSQADYARLGTLCDQGVIS